MGFYGLELGQVSRIRRGGSSSEKQETPEYHVYQLFTDSTRQV
jgi:hypothetical protein